MPETTLGSCWLPLCHHTGSYPVWPFLVSVPRSHETPRAGESLGLSISPSAPGRGTWAHGSPDLIAGLCCLPYAHCLPSSGSAWRSPHFSAGHLLYPFPIGVHGKQEEGWLLRLPTVSTQGQSLKTWLRSFLPSPFLPSLSS